MTNPQKKPRPPVWQAHIDAAGVSYDLSHLDDFQTTFSTQGGTHYKVTVKFGHHVFTRKTEPTDTPDMLYKFCPLGDARTFDHDRYTLSLLLRGFIANFMETPCFNTGNGKFFILQVVTHDGQVREYEIYFRVYRSQNPRGLVLDIRSGFIRDPDRMESRTHQGKIHFGFILSNVQKGQQPKTSGGRKRI